ncbi:MAG TPA: hypothetical protein VI758_01175 [Bacteroidota bacterium]
MAVLNVTISLQSKLNEKTVQVNEFNLVNTVAGILRQDLEKAGYNMAGPPYITSAAVDTIEVCYQVPPPPAYPAGAPTRVKFYAGPASELASTANPSDRILYKSVNGGVPSVVAKGVVGLSFQYFDANGNSTTNVNNIRSFSVDLIMAAGEKVNLIYPTAEWNTRFFPYGMR